MVDITIAICTLNGASRLPEVLEALRKQQGVLDDAWEILLVDNGSTDETKEVLTDFAGQAVQVNCRYVLEKQPGQTAAALHWHSSFISFGHFVV